MKVKVWERGAGLTKACGTAACATAVSGYILKLNESCIDVEFEEGLLNIDWKNDNNIFIYSIDDFWCNCRNRTEKFKKTCCL